MIIKASTATFPLQILEKVLFLQVCFNSTNVRFMYHLLSFPVSSEMYGGRWCQVSAKVECIFRCLKESLNIVKVGTNDSIETRT